MLLAPVTTISESELRVRRQQYSAIEANHKSDARCLSKRGEGQNFAEFGTANEEKTSP